MGSRYAKLKGDWLLRGWTDAPRAMVNWRTGHLRDLGKDAFYVAQSCDGLTDFGSLAFLPRHIALLDKFIAEGIAEECQSGDSLECGQEYRQARNPLIWGIHWAVTGLCNLNCRHCFMESPSGRYGQPSLEEIRSLIDQLERANVLNVSLTGGEPLLRQDLLEISEELTAKRMRLTEIVTNGTLITETLLDSIKRLGQSPVFKISFDGLGVHDDMRGTRGTEEEVIASIRKVRAAGLVATVTTSVDQRNHGQMVGTYELMKKIEVPVWLIGRPQATGNWCGTATALSLEDMAELCLGLLRRWLGDGKPFHILLERFFAGGQGAQADPRGGQPGPFRPDSYECQSVREKPFLMPDGRLLPCTGYTGTYLQEQMPNLRERELSEVWIDSPLRSFADMRKSEVLARDKECAACEMFGSCGAGCRAYALTETGALLAKDPIACAVWKGGHRRRFSEIAAMAAPGSVPNRGGACRLPTPAADAVDHQNGEISRCNE